MLIQDLEKDKCVQELWLISFTVEQVDFILKIKFSQKDVVTWMENNSFQPIKWSIRLELQDKQVLKFQMVNLLFVPELMPKEFMDWMNASKDQKVTSMQELIWFSHKVLILLKNSKSLLRNWKVIRKTFFFWPTWLNLVKLHTSILILSSLMDTTVLFTQFQL